MLFVLATQVDLTQLSCDQAFVEFKKEYPDNRGSSQDIFCENFEIVKKLLLEDPTLEIGLVPLMDTVSPSKKLTPKNGAVSPKKQPHMLQGSINDYCPSFNPLPDLPQIPISMDLREAGLVTPVKAQGGCGSCYAFHTVAVLETAVLRDRENLNDFWKAETSKSSFALSEQFLLSNSFCNQCGYCGGGNFVIQTYLMVKGNQVQKGTPFNSTVTVELDSNYKYDYKVREANWTAKIPLKPKLAPENYLLPVKFFKNSGDCAPWCNTFSNETPTVKVADEKNRKFNASEIYRIKSYIARGMALAIQMDTGLSQTFPYSKSSKILYTECTSYSMNHAVTLVGYGRKEGKDVWIIKNSYGSGWGQQGYFFIEIGSNSFCIEHNAYTLIPKYYNVSETTAYPRGNQVRGLSHTLDCDVFFVKNATKTDYYCYDACPENYPYNEATGQCVVRCASGFYQNFGTMKQCLPACQGLSVVNSSNADSYQCVSCTADSPYFDGTACASRCSSGSYNTIPNNVQPFVCVPSCTFYVLNASNADSQTCLASCPSNFPFSDAGLCSARCTSGAYSNATGPLICQDSCLDFFFVNTTNDNSKLCLSVCPTTQMTNGKECGFVCPAATPFNDSFNCVDLCASKAYSVAKSAQTLQCQDSCPGLYVTNASNNNSKQCVAACSKFYPYNDSLSCSARCASGAYTNTANILTCQASCPDLFVTNTSNSNSKQCISVCPTITPYNDSRTCVAKCGSSAYSIVQGLQTLVCQSSCDALFVFNTSNGNSKRCLSQCPSEVPYNDSFQCLAQCQSKAYQLINSQFTCLPSCKLYTVNETNAHKICYDKCPDAVPYSDNSLCVSRCPLGAYKDMVCQDSCQNYYVVNQSNQDSFQCVDACESNKKNDGNQCVLKFSKSSVIVGVTIPIVLVAIISIVVGIYYFKKNQSKTAKVTKVQTKVVHGGLMLAGSLRE
ncbi:Cathepsin_L [Hexamita inflata]|uniref:Cathepsin L n=1 Tax=Hexamita inflata TaxID=28002 RepID=A0AA86NX95_9EUKA|nr:Cathepsin L [Hexamita inflata]